jgi:hypothetical protein
MGALLDQLAAAGVNVQIVGADKLRAFGPMTDELRAMIRANKHALLGELGVDDVPAGPSHFRWRIGDAERWLEVRFSPPATRTDVLALYPGLPAIPLPDVDGEPDVGNRSLLAPASAGSTRRGEP